MNEFIFKVNNKNEFIHSFNVSRYFMAGLREKQKLARKQRILGSATEPRKTVEPVKCNNKWI